MKKIKIKKINVEDTLEMRHRILLPKQPIEKCYFECDKNKEAAHFGAFSSDELLGIVSISKESCELFQEVEQWRGRAIAVEPRYREKNVGRQLISAIIDHVRQKRGKIIWATSRLSAIPYHKGNGFIPIGEEFDEIINNEGDVIVKVKRIYIRL